MQRNWQPVRLLLSTLPRKDSCSVVKCVVWLNKPKQKDKSHSCFDKMLCLLGAGDSSWKDFGAAAPLRYPVRRHRGVVLAVTPGGPDEEGGGHHLQRDGDEGEVEGPAQRDLHPLWPREVLVEQIQAGQEAADCSQRAQT